MGVILTGALICEPSDLETVLSALPDHIRLTRAERGCLSFEVTQSETNPCRFDVHERFVDRIAFDAHQHRTRASAWWHLTAHIPRQFQLRDT
jgi:quinol monooxygenase YgiN